MLLVSRTPARIDFAGGYTDLIPFASRSIGAVVNAAINLYTYVALQSYDEFQDSGKHSNAVEIHAIDFDAHIRIPDIKRVRYDGELDLVKAVLCRMSVPGGLSVSIRSEAPPGGGLGSSGAMAVALVGALSEYMGNGLSRYEIADVANEVERGIGVCCGKQDHYASALGGINYMEFRGEEVDVSSLKLDPGVQNELERRLCLCYTGKSRFAREMLQNVVNAYFDGNRDTIGAIVSLRRIAFEMKEALLAGDLQYFGKLLHENWRNQRRLHPSVSNSQIDSLFEIALSNGAIGGKACGAGGGGCLVFFCEPDKTDLVRKKLKQVGTQVLEFGFDFSGLQIWSPISSSMTTEVEDKHARVP